MKRICSNEFDLKMWLTDREYKSEIIRPEIQKVNFIDSNSLLKKRPKHQEDSITIVLTFHQAPYIVLDVLKRAHRHVQKSPLLKAFLPKRPRVLLRNQKTLPEKSISLKLEVN